MKSKVIYIILFLISALILSIAITSCTLNVNIVSEHVHTTETTVETTTETTTITEINISMVGDVLAHEGVYGSAVITDGTYTFDHLFTHIKDDISSSDIAIINQETILGGRELGLSAYPLFNSPNEIGNSCVNAGFNVILHATNHALDKGEAGIENTLNFWRTKHPQIAVLGIHATKEDYDNNSVYIYTKNNVKVAVLNYTYSTNGIPLPYDHTVNIMKEDKIKKDLEYARNNADFVIVCPHWGTEYRHTPDESQIKWAQFFADNGADLIIGTHPHVIQPVKYIDNARGGKTLVYYSLGNFVSNQDTVDTMLGAMAKVTITNKGGNVHISKYAVEPLVTHMLFGPGLITTYKLEEYNDTLASQNKVSIFGEKMSMEKLYSICNEVLGTNY